MSKKTVLNLFAPIPALFMGAMVMQRNGISAVAYGQNIICYVALGLILFFLRNKKAAKSYAPASVIATLVAACLLLSMTFLDRGLDGVHRWLSIGNFRLYISSIILPSVVIMIGKLWQDQKELVSVAILLVIVAILVMQPDASQLSAFSAAMVFWVLIQTKRKAIQYALPCALVACVVYAWIHIAGLEAVPHVEGILILAGDMGGAYSVLGFSSLVILLLPFLNFSHASTKAKAVGIYYFVMITSTFFGKFPVPFMGYGISPIVGYLLAVFFLMRDNSNTENALRSLHMQNTAGSV